jgi:hypothetical protein
MVCPNCQQPTNRIRVYSGAIKACARCLGLSEAAGVKIDGSLTRSASRIRDQQRTHEGDIIAPHIFDKNTRDLVPNPDFMKLHPDKIATNYSQKELEKAGHSKIGKVFKEAEVQRAAHAREAASGITYRRTPKP